MKNTKQTEKQIDLSLPIEEGILNEVITITKTRPNGTLEISQDFKYCPTKTEQHSARETDLNYLMATFTTDELAAYIAARSARKQEIIGYDFSQEPSLQEAHNEVARIKYEYSQLPEELQQTFKHPAEFLKFIDNPANQEKMIELKLLSRKQIEKIIDTPNQNIEQNNDAN